MERVLSKRSEHGAGIAKVVLESVVTVPSEHLEGLMAAFRAAGIDAWDTGQRTTTEEGLDALADVRLRVTPP